MELFLMIFGTIAFSFSAVYVVLRLFAWVEGRKW